MPNYGYAQGLGGLLSSIGNVYGAIQERNDKKDLLDKEQARRDQESKRQAINDQIMRAHEGYQVDPSGKISHTAEWNQSDQERKQKEKDAQDLEYFTRGIVRNDQPSPVTTTPSSSAIPSMPSSDNSGNTGYLNSTQGLLPQGAPSIPTNPSAQTSQPIPASPGLLPSSQGTSRFQYNPEEQQKRKLEMDYKKSQATLANANAQEAIAKAGMYRTKANQKPAPLNVETEAYNVLPPYDQQSIKDFQKTSDDRSKFLHQLSPLIDQLKSKDITDAQKYQIIQQSAKVLNSSQVGTADAVGADERANMLASLHFSITPQWAGGRGFLKPASVSEYVDQLQSLVDRQKEALTNDQTHSDALKNKGKSLLMQGMRGPKSKNTQNMSDDEVQQMRDDLEKQFGAYQ